MKLTKQSVKEYLSTLSSKEVESLFTEVRCESAESPVTSALSRREILDNKQGECPHCGHSKYVKTGKDKGSQRYKCKSCKRSFTEYTGTWMAGLHKKDRIDEYITLMVKEKSLDKITEELSINKKTAFDWRHKILSSFEDIDKDIFTGITESDETFILFSEKGSRTLDRPGKKRGGKSKKKGISNDQVAVIATADRAGQKDLTVATLGRLKKVDIATSIGERISDKTILCTDSHVSYKGFAKDNSIEHFSLRANIKEYVKENVYHIQHINSMHNRLKKWINDKFWGVSSKYLQQYLNWFRLKEILKQQKLPLSELGSKSILDIKTNQRYKAIDDRYKLLTS